MLSRIWALVIKDFLHLKNDWWMPAFMLIGGVMELYLIGWATARPITNLPLVVFDQDQTSASRQVVEMLENTGTFNLQYWAQNMSDVQYVMERGQVNAAVVIPTGFGDQMISSNQRPVLMVLINGSESAAANEALRAIDGAIQSLSERLVLQRYGFSAGDLSKFDFSVRVRFNEELSEAYYTTPAELALMLEFTILLFAGLAFSRERELGTLEQLLVMPFSSLDIILGKAIPVVVIGFADFGLMLAMVHYAFGVPIRGSLLLLLILAFIYLLAELGKGMVISVLSRTQHQAFLLVLLWGMVDFMFTGYAIPVESMPPVLQWFSVLIPANHWLAIVRGILLKGSNLTVLWPHVLALLILGGVIGGVSTRIIRRVLV
jgi:ABC-2 type transport system permease protein